ncbi:MAG TPA: tetratricopeptide repeat protein [Enhygromyxa sp.]|nr:tetratricopeptide repeat protein [Enhygromyxa sp.]
MIDSAPIAGGDESGDANEDPIVEEAKAEYRAGSDAYALGNYQEAVTHFERSYELTHQPELLFNLGQSYTRWYDISNDLEHLKKARRLYENYVLNVGATDMDEEQQAQARADAQRRIAEVDRRIAQHEDSTGPTPVDDDKPKKPVYKKAWFWVTIVGGLAVIGGVTAAVVLTSNRESGFEPELGTLGRASLTGGEGGLRLRF